MDLKETDLLGADVSRHWYYQSKARAMRHMLQGTFPQRVLDVGAGSGFFTQTLMAQASTIEGWCLDISYRQDSELIWHGKRVHFVRQMEHVDADLVLFMDVLEHVDDDVGLLSAVLRRVAPQAKVLISVPAFQSLWSGHDVFLEHKRRYRLQGIESVAERAGLQVLAGCYYFGAVFPVAALLRGASRWLGSRDQEPRSQLKRHSPWVNATLSAACSLELAGMRHNRLAGLTAFCLAQRR